MEENKTTAIHHVLQDFQHATTVEQTVGSLSSINEIQNIKKKTNDYARQHGLSSPVSPNGSSLDFHHSPSAKHETSPETFKETANPVLSQVKSRHEKKANSPLSKLRSALSFGQAKSVDNLGSSSISDHASTDANSQESIATGRQKILSGAWSSHRASRQTGKSSSPTDKKFINLVPAAWTSRRSEPRASSSAIIPECDDLAVSVDVSSDAQWPLLIPPNYEKKITDRSPALLVITNSSEQWALELIAIPNNGIRREICDMYKMFRDMERRPFMLTVDDIEVLQKWLRSFEAILRQLFEVEEINLYEWIEGRDLMSSEQQKWEDPKNKLTGEFFVGKRLLRKGTIMQHLNDVAEFSVGSFGGRPVVERMEELGNLVDRFVIAMLDYLNMKESTLPKVIEGNNLTEKECRRYELRFWSCIKKVSEELNDTAGAAIVSMTRGMERNQRSRWQRKYLPKSQRGAYQKWVSDYNKNHFSAVVELQKRVDLALKERMAALEEQQAMNNHAQLAAKARELVWGDDDKLGEEGTATDCSDVENDTVAGDVTEAARQSPVTGVHETVEWPDNTREEESVVADTSY